MKVKAKPVLERDILNEICLWLKEQGFFFWRSNNIPVYGMNNGGKMTFRSMPKFSMKGVPDIIVIREGMFIGLEVKRPKAKIREDQFIFEACCRANGGIYHIVYALDDVKIIMQRFL